MKHKSPSARVKELFSSNALPTLAVITSPDQIRRTRAIGHIEEQLSKKNLAIKSFTFTEMHKDNVRSFLTELGEPSLFEPHRIGHCRGIEKAKAADIEPVAKFIQDLPPGVTLLLSGADLPNSQLFKKSIGDHHIHFEALQGAELRRWAEREFALQEISEVSDELVEYIIAIAEESPDQVSAYVEKFSLFLNGATPTLSALQQLFPAQVHANDFELAETILTAPRARVEVTLTQLVEQGSSPFMLMGLLGKTWSSLLAISALNQKGLGGNEIRNQLGLSSWIFNKYLPLSKRLSAEAATSSIEALMEADFALKDRSLGPEVVLSKLARTLRSNQK